MRLKHERAFTNLLAILMDGLVGLVVWLGWLVEKQSHPQKIRKETEKNSMSRLACGKQKTFNVAPICKLLVLPNEHMGLD